MEHRMTFEDFQQSLGAKEPPSELTSALAGLWWDATGDWAHAHESVQQANGSDSSWVHAYLHRKQGDRENAAGWYSRAGKLFCEQSLNEEWGDIARKLLAAMHDTTGNSSRV